MTRESAAAIEDLAARWAARLDAGTLDDAAESELATWLAGDPRRDGALLQAQAALSMFDPAVSRTPDGRDDDSAQSPRFGRRSLIGGGAAALAASVLGLMYFTAGASYETAVGEIRRVPLDDGSTAVINTASRVAFELGRDQRLVRLDQGEAWFQVAKDRKRPFLVEAGRVRVRAVGTAFSVRRVENGVEVLVTEGVVAAWAEGAEGQMIRIAAGGRAYIGDNAAIERTHPAASSVDRALAWRAGKIDLVGQPLNEAVAEFNRYNRRKLVISDPKLGAERFDGIFRTDDPLGFAHMIEVSLDVPVDASNPQEIRIGTPKR